MWLLPELFCSVNLTAQSAKPCTADQWSLQLPKRVSQHSIGSSSVSSLRTLSHSKSEFPWCAASIRSQYQESFLELSRFEIVSSIIFAFYLDTFPLFSFLVVFLACQYDHNHLVIKCSACMAWRISQRSQNTLLPAHTICLNKQIENTTVTLWQKAKDNHRFWEHTKNTTSWRKHGLFHWFPTAWCDCCATMATQFVFGGTVWSHATDEWLVLHHLFWCAEETP